MVIQISVPFALNPDMHRNRESAEAAHTTTPQQLERASHSAIVLRCALNLHHGMHALNGHNSLSTRYGVLALSQC